MKYPGQWYTVQVLLVADQLNGSYKTLIDLNQVNNFIRTSTHDGTVSASATIKIPNIY